MPRLTVYARLRQTLRRLLHDEGYGAAAALCEFSAHRPGGTEIQATNLSFFLHETKGRRYPITIDDLDDIAAFFNMSIGQLFGPTQTGELSGDEQRVIHAFRALPEPTQAHFLAILEAASVAARSARHHH